jgi:tRNA1Val (adenine37-N6)-methyltransferase
LAKSTVDTLFDTSQQIKIYQPKEGYRYSMDPVILASQVSPFPGCKIIDIGCGCGIIPVILCHRYKDIHVTGVEIQSQLADFATKNIKENRMQDQVLILNQDIKTTSIEDTKGLADIVVANPPYKKRDTGRLNPNIQKAIARHEIKLDLSQFFSRAKSLLKPRGRLIFIFPADRLQEVLLGMTIKAFQLDWIQFIHTRKKNPAKLILVSGLREGHGSCIVRPPLFIYKTNNNPTNEYAAMFKP